MLYMTTKEKFDAFTPARTLQSDRGPDGGLYLPYRMPQFDEQWVGRLSARSFGQNVAEILNMFFRTQLTGWDVEFSIGRYPVKIASVGQKVLSAELWRNLNGSYGAMERQLAALVCGCSVCDVKVTSWLRIAIRCAVLAGLFGELQRQGVGDTVDVSVSDGDFSLAVSVWYCKQWGLPIGNIICGCRNNSPVWDLIHGGQLRCGNDAQPELERLVYGCLGFEENQRFCACMENAGVYIPGAQMHRLLSSAMFVAVVSNDRSGTAIPNVYSTNGYILDPESAVSYCALQDFRARTGESRQALIFSGSSPADDADSVCAALKISLNRLKELLV